MPLRIPVVHCVPSSLRRLRTVEIRTRSERESEMLRVVLNAWVTKTTAAEISGESRDPKASSHDDHQFESPPLKSGANYWGTSGGSFGISQRFHRLWRVKPWRERRSGRRAPHASRRACHPYRRHSPSPSLARQFGLQCEVLDVLVQSKRNKHAALKLMRKLLKKYAFAPERLVTDDLRSYSAAVRELGIERRHERGRWRNNRAENSHHPTRRRERKMQRFSRSTASPSSATLRPLRG